MFLRLVHANWWYTSVQPRRADEAFRDTTFVTGYGPLCEPTARTRTGYHLFVFVTLRTMPRWSDLRYNEGDGCYTYDPQPMNG